jgi:hypothetical protein
MSLGIPFSSGGACWEIQRTAEKPFTSLATDATWPPGLRSAFTPPVELAFRSVTYKFNLPCGIRAQAAVGTNSLTASDGSAR